MKRLLLISSMLFLVISLSAQANWELGVRFGDDFAFDATIPLAKAPRLHPTVYVYNGIAIGTYFDWLFAVEGGPHGLKLYPGVGPEIYLDNDLDLAVAGNFGIEYSFDFPLSIALDWRPRIMLTDGGNFYAGNWGLIARFRFGEGMRLVPAN